MKASELMVGDWALFHTGYAKVTGITDAGIHFVDRFGGGIASGADPIPLTAEILEKNGFLRDGESWWYKDFRIVLSTSKGESLVCGRQMRFEYVHELQHAMSLCKIEKEIEL